MTTKCGRCQEELSADIIKKKRTECTKTKCPCKRQKNLRRLAYQLNCEIHDFFPALTGKILSGKTESVTSTSVHKSSLYDNYDDLCVYNRMAVCGDICCKHAVYGG